MHGGRTANESLKTPAMIMWLTMRYCLLELVLKGCLLAAAVPRLSSTRLLDRGQLAKNTQFLFTTGKEGQLAIEGEMRSAQCPSQPCHNIHADVVARSWQVPEGIVHLWRLLSCAVNTHCKCKHCNSFVPCLDMFTHVDPATASDISTYLCAGITPAPLRDRRPVFFGTFPNPRLAPALLAQFLGPDPIDEDAKAEAGSALVFAINGFRCACHAFAIVRLLLHRVRT